MNDEQTADNTTCIAYADDDSHTDRALCCSAKTVASPGNAQWNKRVNSCRSKEETGVADSRRASRRCYVHDESSNTEESEAEDVDASLL